MKVDQFLELREVRPSIEFEGHPGWATPYKASCDIADGERVCGFGETVEKAIWALCTEVNKRRATCEAFLNSMGLQPSVAPVKLGK
jgi:hypothetical protein